MADDGVTIDLNTADVETLKKLPSVGRWLAKGIMEARPFASVDDLVRVNGIGPALVARLRPLVWVSEASDTAVETQQSAPPAEAEHEPLTAVARLGAPAEAGQPDEAAASELETIETAGQVEAPVEEAAHQPDAPITVEVEEALPREDVPQQEVPPAQAVQPVPTGQISSKEAAMMTRALGCRFALLSALLAAALGLVVSLGFLSNLNDGSLRYVSSSEMFQVRLEIEQLSTRVDTIAGDVEGLRKRVDNLDTLGQRVILQGETLEQLETAVLQLEEDTAAASTQMETLSQELEPIAAQVETLSQEVEPIAAQVEALETQSKQFQSFLQGLRDLMNGVFSLEEQE